MSLAFRIEMIALALVILLVVLRSIRRGRMLIRFSPVWFFLAVGILVVAVFPDIAGWFCDLVNIETPSNLVYLLGILILFLIALRLTEMVSLQSEQIKRLTQELSLERLRAREEREDTAP